jgi:pyrroline-5-carboxylate reductase
MGGAMLRGWLDLGLEGARILVIEPQPSDDLRALCAASGARLADDASAGAPVEALVLAVKPQSFTTAAPSLAPLVGPQTTVLSIMAGKTIADISQRLPGVGGIVRSMPNTPAAIGRGVTGACASPGLDPARRAMTDALLSSVGAVVWLDDEALIDAVTAVSGSGPAYVFLLAECMAAAGEKLGLPADVAARLARATVEGSGELLRREAGSSPADLRVAVTSPGGTTAAALSVLMADDGLAPLLERAIAAAARRAGELSG